MWVFHVYHPLVRSIHLVTHLSIYTNTAAAARRRKKRKSYFDMVSPSCWPGRILSSFGLNGSLSRVRAGLALEFSLKLFSFLVCYERQQVRITFKLIKAIGGHHFESSCKFLIVSIISSS